MVNDNYICVKISKNNNTLNVVKEKVNLEPVDWNHFVDVLHSVQKLVNESLTELVEQERQSGVITEENSDDEDDDNDDENKKEVVQKRKDNSENVVNKKIKK